MIQTAPHTPSPEILIPDAPAVVATARQAVWLTPEGEVRKISHSLAAASLQTALPIVCHAPLTAQRLGLKTLGAFDVLELFAFVRPAQFCLPTPGGLAKALDLPPPVDTESQAMTLLDAVRVLLDALADPLRENTSNAAAIAQEMNGWVWQSFVLKALGQTTPLPPEQARRGLKVWDQLPEWAETAPEAEASQRPVTQDEAEIRLTAMLGDTAEARPQQIDYTRQISDIFAPTQEAASAHLVLAEAGTGIGKTLGYLAPATVWAEKNGGAVWVSTYTKNLQQQVDEELSRYYDTPEIQAQKVTVRKGRENYLCLLNLEDAVQNPGRKNQTQNAIATGLMARWAATTQNGDFSGADFPGWLTTLLGFHRTRGLADKRGECIYSACPHFHRCFVEKGIRKAKRADIVIANHALVMHQAALSGPEDILPTRYVFDEGHHIFDAADSAFCAHLTGRQMEELRRWIRGAEEGQRSRARGLARRLEDLVSDDDDSKADLDDILEAASSLPGRAWHQRLYREEPRGAAEDFLARVREQLYARTGSEDNLWSLECETQPVIDGIPEAAKALAAKLDKLRRPMERLSEKLHKRLVDQSDTLDSDSRQRIESLCNGLNRRAKTIIQPWEDMLGCLQQKTPENFVDWFGIERSDGRDNDVGFYRHWVDPTAPFAASIKHHAHGIAVTSATLTDSNANWDTAELRSGFQHMQTEYSRLDIPSPFDYGAQTKIFVITDVNRNDTEQVAAAYRSLFTAAGGGALGLFTAIHRLRNIHKKLLEPLEKAGLPLYAQHVDGLDVGTLIDIFRAEENACLLGTDATRDGIDVPGRSLRLIAFDRVPWPRPSLLHKSRRDLFGKGYDDMLTRLKLKQAYGRLIRRQNDRGVFVMLDSMMPSRLCDAFPPGVEIQRIGLADAVKLTTDFLQ